MSPITTRTVAPYAAMMNAACAGSPTLRSLRLQETECAHAPTQNFVAHGGEMQRDKQKREGERHHQEWRQDRGINAGSGQAKDRGALVQRVPPVDRELDDWKVDRADQRQDRGGPAGARRIFDRVPKRNQ